MVAQIARTPLSPVKLRDITYVRKDIRIVEPTTRELKNLAQPPGGGRDVYAESVTCFIEIGDEQFDAIVIYALHDQLILCWHDARGNEFYAALDLGTWRQTSVPCIHGDQSSDFELLMHKYAVEYWRDGSIETYILGRLPIG